MADLTKLNVALCQVEVVEGRPSCYENALSALIARVRSTGAHLAVVSPDSFGCARPRLIAMNGAVLLEEERCAELAIGGELYRIGFDGGNGEGSADGSDGSPCQGAPDEPVDFIVSSRPDPWTLGLPAEECLGLGDDSASTRPSDARLEGLPVPLVMANPVGIANRDKNVVAYDGASAVYGADGALLARLRDDFSGDYAPVSLVSARRLAPLCDMKLLTCIVTTMRRFDAQVLPWTPKWVIGLSGGLDSSVVAALLVMAFGPSRVVGYNLATRFNSDITKANAAHLAQALGIELRNGSIEHMVEATGATLSQYGYADDVMAGLVLENVQARVRGHLLSTFAAIEGGVVANNGNRIEAALGYATLYGDAIGALAPLGDLTKVQLFDIARQVNAVFGDEVIPENLLPRETDEGFEWEMMPSAELADGQRDPMKWFYHDWLVSTLIDETSGDPCPIMERYLQDKFSSLPVGKWVRFYGLDDPVAFVEDLEWVLRQMRNAAFKRIQAPPAIRFASSRSIAPAPEVQGAHEPTERYQQLRAALGL